MKKLDDLQIVDGYVDRSDSAQLFTSDGEPFDETKPFVCLDVRKIEGAIRKLGHSMPSIVYDVGMMYEGDMKLRSLAKSKNVASYERFLDTEKRFTAHTTAISNAKMNIDEIQMTRLIPPVVVDEYMMMRVKVISELWEMRSEKDIHTYDTLVWPTYQDIRKMSPIFVDVDRLKKLLVDNTIAVHERKFLQHIDGVTKGGWATTRISPVGSKTWRFRVESGLQVMSMPKGVCRSVVTSRFDGGSIFSVDFNAIDYRSIVEAVNDQELNEFYSGKVDFHRETASLFGDVTPELRDITKKITYCHVYGSSFESLQRTTRLPSVRLRSMLEILDRKFEPIMLFRKRLAEESRQRGWLTTPGGHVVTVEKGDHDGKIIGLFAQTYSSYVLIRALHAALEILGASRALSSVLFTVHDEIIFDIHPDEEHIVQTIATAIHAVTGFVVKIKKGKNYDEATK